MSAEAPFEMKKATDGFLKALPTDLRDFIMMKKRTTNFGKTHRFWIENGGIPCYENKEDGKFKFEFYYTPMVVKKNLMKINSQVSTNLLFTSFNENIFKIMFNEQGELVDDFDDSEDELTDDSEDESEKELNPSKKKISAEARFVRTADSADSLNTMI